MGFHVEINFILRSDIDYDLTEGAVHDFRKSGSRVFIDEFPVWLARSDWTALAEIEIVTQSRTTKEVTGQFRVAHAYSDSEQAAMTETFRRMYSFPGQFDPYFYLLESREIYDAAAAAGYLVRRDLRDEGFIHASPANQLTRVANKHFNDVKDVVCALVAKERVLAQVKYEPANAGVYPHIFGPLNMDAVEHVVDIKRDANGTFDIDMEAILKAQSQYRGRVSLKTPS